MDLNAFIHRTAFEHLPLAVVRQAERCVLDLAGAAAAGIGTKLSHIIRNHAVRNFCADRGGARMLLDGRRVSAVGAALAGGMTIDSFDSHDGHALTKGHAGAAVLPALLAVTDADSIALSGRDFLTALIIGYEVAIRAGIATHRIAPDYHTSGSWNALGATAIAARVRKLDADKTRHALGIAEYHGPRSQMMRCIDFPTMLKDGSGWGAMTGVSAADLAQDGFTGAPALVAESQDVIDLWSDLGNRWRILEMYFKPYPVCRWAQPAIEAALGLMAEHHLLARDIERIEVTTFHEATRLSTARPASTEEAQYSLPFPVAAAIVKGSLGPAEIDNEALRDPEILRLSIATALRESQKFNDRFPAERYAQVTFWLRDGRTLVSDETRTRGDPESALSDDALLVKFSMLASGSLDSGRRARITRRVETLGKADTSAVPLMDELLEPISREDVHLGDQIKA